MMATGPSYRIPFRRRREGKTDYQSRKALVLSERPRLVIRHTSRYIIIQILKAKTTGDQVVVSAHSRELPKTYGWQGGCSNIPAAYLTGLLCGHKALTRGVKEAVLDLGLYTLSQGSRIFAAVKGVKDAGLRVPHKTEMIPKENRLEGKHIADYAHQIASDTESYQRRFSNYLSRKLPPEQLPEHFALVKKQVVTSFETKEKKS